MKLKSNQIILFQGDSITDWGRSREITSGLDSAALGTGYPYIIAARLAAAYPELDLSFYNRGISGNRVADLRDRWGEDCIDLNPDIISIMIGINDTWRRYDSNLITSAEDYERDYRHILNKTRSELPDAEMLLIEPFVLPCPADREAWREDLDPKIAAVRKLAREFGTLLLPADGLLNAASTRVNPEFWAYDGVHLTAAGAAFLADRWIELIER